MTRTIILVTCLITLLVSCTTNSNECGTQATYIHTIQGSKTNSPLVNKVATIEGVVVANFSSKNQLSGFFVQEETADFDNNPATSEGIFIFNPKSQHRVSLGDQVRIKGRVAEFGGMTQLDKIQSIHICQTNQPVKPMEVQLPFSSNHSAESLEGMLVTLPQKLTISDTGLLGRYGEVTLSNGRLFNPTDVYPAGPKAAQLKRQNELNQLILDDGSSQQNPSPVKLPAPQLSYNNFIRSGDQLTGVTGVINQAFDRYRIQPTERPQILRVNPRTAIPEKPQDNIRIASFNLLNFFNGDGQGSGFPTQRGADSYLEFSRQKAKTISALTTLNADVFGLMEIENDGFDKHSAIAELVRSLNQSSGRTFQFIQPTSNQLGSDQITVGLVYDTQTISPQGSSATIANKAFSWGNRQPLAQTFIDKRTGNRFSVVVNHFKSKGSCPDDEQSPNAAQGDGQACWNLLRTQAANQLVEWIKEEKRLSEHQNILIIGDLNAYSKEDPLLVLESQGFTNLPKKFSPTSYSYIFRGQSGSLDHILASQPVVSLVTNSFDWHINADEPSVFDYNLEYKTKEQQELYYNTGPYRTSDHDPVIVDIKL